MSESLTGDHFDPLEQSQFPEFNEEIPGLFDGIEDHLRQDAATAPRTVEVDAVIPAHEQLDVDQEQGPIVSEAGWKNEYQRVHNQLQALEKDHAEKGTDPLADVDYMFALGELNAARKQVIAHTMENTTNALRHLFEE